MNNNLLNFSIEFTLSAWVQCVDKISIEIEIFSHNLIRERQVYVYFLHE